MQKKKKIVFGHEQEICIKLSKKTPKTPKRKLKPKLKQNE